MNIYKIINFYDKVDVHTYTVPIKKQFLGYRLFYNSISISLQRNRRFLAIDHDGGNYISFKLQKLFKDLTYTYIQYILLFFIYQRRYIVQRKEDDRIIKYDIVSKYLSNLRDKYLSNLKEKKKKYVGNPVREWCGQSTIGGANCIARRRLL